MKRPNCKLQLKDFYFSKYDFNMKSRDIDEQYNISYNFKYEVNASDDSDIRVTIDTNIVNVNESIELNLQTTGIFEIDKTDIDEETYNVLLRANTVAIMFPYIRAQISLLTTQPGLKPIMIPPVNVNEIINSKN